MICVSVIVDKPKKFLTLYNKISSIYELIELRVDKVYDIDLKNLLVHPRPKIIYTLRDKSIGENERLNLFTSAIDSKVDFIDIDIEMLTANMQKLIKYAKEKNTKVILSYHNFEKTPDELPKIYNKLKLYSPDYIKIACYANDIGDNIKIFKLLKQKKNETSKLIAFCMGEKGEISRILSPKFGSAITYASLKPELETAEGQIPVQQLESVYNYHQINPDTKIFGLVGNPVKQSQGIYTHNRVFKYNRLNAVYVNFLVDKFPKFIKEYKPIITGLSITKPFKEVAIKFLDEISEEVKEIGAVNTIIKKNNKLFGYNTDAMALMSLLPENLSRKTVAVLGTGGAARSAIYSAIKKKANVIVFGRDQIKAKNLAKHFGCEYDKLSNIPNHKFKVLINATSVGMMPDYTDSPVDEKILKQGMLVVDFVYNPAITRLLIFAKSKGCDIIKGLDIFKKQASLQRNFFRRAILDE